MTDEQANQRRIKNIKELDDALGERGLSSAHIAAAGRVRDAAIEEANRFFNEYTKEHVEANAEIDVAAAEYIRIHRRGLLGRYGRTIKLSNGVVKVRVIPKSVTLPKDPSMVIKFLEEKPGGKRYLHNVPQLDKRKIATITKSGFLRALNGLGVSIARNELVSYQSNLEEKPTIISRRKFPYRT